MKNVAADVRFSEQAGLIDTKQGAGKEISPHVTYDKILLEISV
jgi:predicted transcriptional regulator